MFALDEPALAGFEYPNGLGINSRTGIQTRNLNSIQIVFRSAPVGNVRIVIIGVNKGVSAPLS